ncbi:MAG: DUF4349 domain-containing protein [Planctomycetota bacterium]
MSGPTVFIGDAAPARRDVVYQGAMVLVVEKIGATLNRIREIAVSLEGYLQEMTADSIIVKIPVAKFQSALDEIGKLGEVTKLDVKGEDVTEKLQDLEIRLKNAEESRRRLLTLLEKGGKMEEILAVEKEIERVTETIELLKGKIRYVRENIRFSTLTVFLNSPLPQKASAAEIPFAWIDHLGEDLVKGVVRNAYDYRSGRRGPRFKLPEAYVKYHESENLTRAMSADGVFIRVEKHENYEGGSLEFWFRLIRRTLVERKAIAIQKEEPLLKIAAGADARMLTGAKEIGQQGFGYLVSVAADKKFVYTFEAWGPKDNFAADLKKLTESAGSLYVK